MRTTLDLEESLLREAMKLLGTTTKRKTVRQAPQALVAQKRRERLRAKLERMKLSITLSHARRE
jgi:Arc/MetJ family transcription regulator